MKKILSLVFVFVLGVIGVIYLQNNEVSEKINTCLKGNCKKLDLSSNKLTDLPKGIGKLQNLIILDLSHNQLTKLSRDIGKLQNLEVLSLNHNQLIKLPKRIGQLQNLEVLSLSYNRLTRLPKKIGQLQKLQTLDLKENNFSEDEKQKIKTLLPNCEIKF